MTVMPAPMSPRLTADDASMSSAASRADGPTTTQATGDREGVDAFADALAGLRPRLIRLLAARLRSQADADDVVQDAMLRAWRFRDRYDARRPLAAWVYRIALNAEADHRRRRGAVLEPAPTGPADPAPGPVALAVADEQAQQLWRTAEAVLSDHQYTIVWLAYVEQLTPREIARTTGRRSGTVRVALHRARARLADALAHKTSEPAMPSPRAQP